MINYLSIEESEKYIYIYSGSILLKAFSKENQWINNFDKLPKELIPYISKLSDMDQLNIYVLVYQEHPPDVQTFRKIQSIVDSLLSIYNSTGDIDRVKEILDLIL